MVRSAIAIVATLVLLLGIAPISQPQAQNDGSANMPSHSKAAPTKGRFVLTAASGGWAGRPVALTRRWYDASNVPFHCASVFGISLRPRSPSRVDRHRADPSALAPHSVASP
jgi:hypothetical protein